MVALFAERRHGKLLRSEDLVGRTRSCRAIGTYGKPGRRAKFVLSDLARRIGASHGTAGAPTGGSVMVNGSDARWTVILGLVALLGSVTSGAAATRCDRL